MVWADESIEPTEPVDPSIVVLEPGHNYVGWVAAPLSVDVLMRRIPEITAVRAWDGLRQRSYTPTDLTAGMGVRVTLSGEELRTWRRPMTPVKGKIELHRGRNLVTWLGPDGWTIDRVVLGIGRSFVKAEWGGTEYRASSVLTARSRQPVRRGDAIWIEVSRTVNWLQPAGVLPKIVFAGEGSSEAKATVRKDSLDVMNHYAEEFGLQPDGSILTVYVATDPDSLYEVMDQDGRDVELEGTRAAWYDAGGWATPQYIVLKLEQWDPDYVANENQQGDHGYGRYVLAHEYYHAIQYQFSGVNAGWWLIEGGADWAEAGLRLKDEGTSFSDELSANRTNMAAEDAPPLDHAERRVGSWHYTLGALASHLLALRSGGQSLLEFWQLRLPEPLGPLGRWQSHPPWQHTFHNVFGITVDTFYEEFAAWREGLAAVAIRGRVVGPDGKGLPFVKVTARTENLEGNRYDYSGDTHTEADGRFELIVTEGGGAKVGVDLGGCEIYYSSDGLVSGVVDASIVSSLATIDEELSIVVSEDSCVWQIQGMLTDAEGNGISNHWIYTSLDTGGGPSMQTQADGTFSATVPAAGRYRLWTRIDDCTVYYRSGEAPGGRQQATQLHVQDSDVTGIRFQLTEGLCSTRITGTLLDAAAKPIANTRVYAWCEKGDGSSALTDSEGVFAITVHEAGQCRVSVWVDGCSIYYRGGHAPGSLQHATQIQVDDSGTSDITLQLAEGMCEHRISGRLLNADGTPRSGQWVGAIGNAGDGGAHSAADGSFSFAVPGNGSYRLSVWIDDCSIRLGNRGPTTDYWSAREVRVSNADVTDIEFRLPEDPASFCN